MKRFLLGIILGIALILALVWYWGDRNAHAHLMKHDIQQAADNTRQYVQDKLGDPDLSAQNIKDELARTGMVVRQKAQAAGNAIADATRDTRIEASIKTKLVADQRLSALNISVNSVDGLVTLSGKAASPENIRQAIQIALDTDGVNKVVSTLQVAK